MPPVFSRYSAGWIWKRREGDLRRDGDVGCAQRELHGLGVDRLELGQVRPCSRRCRTWRSRRTSGDRRRPRQSSPRRRGGRCAACGRGARRWWPGPTVVLLLDPELSPPHAAATKPTEVNTTSAPMRCDRFMRSPIWNVRSDDGSPTTTAIPQMAEDRHAPVTWLTQERAEARTDDRDAASHDEVGELPGIGDVVGAAVVVVEVVRARCAADPSPPGPTSTCRGTGRRRPSPRATAARRARAALVAARRSSTSPRRGPTPRPATWWRSGAAPARGSRRSTAGCRSTTPCSGWPISSTPSWSWPEMISSFMMRWRSLRARTGASPARASTATATSAGQ